VNAILIASRGLKMHEPCTYDRGHIFQETVRLPGYWGGACAGCKWKDHAMRCSYSVADEPKYVPQHLASLPRNLIEELE
jgi:hypothetical protein